MVYRKYIYIKLVCILRRQQIHFCPYMYVYTPPTSTNSPRLCIILNFVSAAVILRYRYLPKVYICVCK